jgi:hypothetical protein
LVLITLYETVFEILQTLKEPYASVIDNSSSEQVRFPMNGSDDCSQRHWRNVVLEHMYQSLSDDEGGIQGCVREALSINPKIDCTLTIKVYAATKVACVQLKLVIISFCSHFPFFFVVQQFDHCDEDRRKSSQTGWMSNGSQKAANGHTGVTSRGFLNESDHHTINQKCQHAFLDILISDKFTSLCKLLFENFEGIKADIFDFSIINTRMKDGAYERSPTLFSSDIQQVILSCLFFFFFFNLLYVILVPLQSFIPLIFLFM